MAGVGAAGGGGGGGGARFDEADSFRVWDPIPFVWVTD